MALSLPSSLIQAKNLLESDEPTLVLVRLTVVGVASDIHLVANDVDITWDSETWSAFPFEIDNIGEPARGELPSVSLRVSNVTRAVQGYVDQADGGVDSDVKIYVIDGADLGNTTPYIELDFRVQSTSCDENWVTFQLTSYDTWRRTFPRNRILKNTCSFKFKGPHCGYSGGESECNRTLPRCRELNNSERFGGFIGAGYRGVRL